MKRIVFIIFLSTVFYFLSASSLTGKIVLKVSGLSPQKGGNLSVGLFNKNNFLTSSNITGKYISIKNNQHKVTFDNIPVGTYCLAVFQDIDKNKKLGLNFIGYPKEPFGFSNNAKIKFGPPLFDEAKVTLKSNKTLFLTINLE